MIELMHMCFIFVSNACEMDLISLPMPIRTIMKANFLNAIRHDNVIIKKLVLEVLVAS